MALSPPLGRRPRRAMLVLGAALIAAALWFGYMYFVGVVVGLAEPVHPTSLEYALIVSEGLIPVLLFASGLGSVLCRTRGRLWVVAALAAATIVDAGVSFILYGPAVRSACLQYLAKQGPVSADNPVDTSCMNGK